MVAETVSTISFYRPDIFENSNENVFPPISLNPPFGFLDPVVIPHVGELMLASFPFDSKFVISLSDNNTWWMGEKYDGIRFCWNPVHEVAYSRGGNEFVLPKQIENLLPSSCFIDGEFWFGRGLYVFTYSLFKGSPHLVHWDLFRMLAFDVPNKEYQKIAYEDRYIPLLYSISFDHPFSVIASRILCKNDKHLSTAVQELIDEEGEGIILQKVNSLYVHGRTPNLIKLKTSYADMEGIIVSLGKDKSVELKLPNGTIFTVPPQSIQITNPQIGAIVTFSYESHTRRDVPSSPKITRVRTDLTWEEVVENSKKDRKYLNEHFKVEGYKTKAQGHWTTKNMRSFMENFARKHHLDPADPATWLSLPSSSLLSTKDGNTVLQKYKGYSKTIVNLFPDLNFEGKSFVHSTWNDIQMRRKFFEDYAKDNHFDPLVKENWYSQPIDLVLSSKGSASVLYHHRTMSQALLDLFPDVALDPIALNWDRSIWSDEAMRRKFFENFARANKFDPLVANNWYRIPREKIMSTKGASKIVFYHKHSISQALVDLFPNIGIKKDLVWPTTFSWRNPENRRNFFLDYSISCSFDPLVPQNWYKINPESIMSSSKYATRILFYHHNSVQQALLDLFPNIGLEKSKFQSTQVVLNEKERKKILENYAQDKGFDPRDPEAWYLQSKQKIMSYPGVQSLITYHKGSLVQAMFDLFPNIHLVKANLWTKRLWQNKVRRRKFFEDYAKAKEFDPLLPNNWYSQSAKNIMSFEGAYGVVNFHGRSVQQAIIELFPEIGLDKNKFPSSPEYDKAENRRKFFLNIAKENKFDAFKAENWYSLPRHKLFAHKGAFSVISYHGNKLSTSLSEIFPDLNIDPSKMSF